jgi:lipopolysaccharide transport system permease protein
MRFLPGQQAAAEAVVDQRRPRAIAEPVAAAGGRPRRVHVIEPRRAGIRSLVREAVANRWCTMYFGRLYLKRRYRRTWLGFMWVPLKPGFNMASKILVFGAVIGISAGKTPYPIFFLVASAAWQLFAEVAMWATRSIDVARNHLNRIELPRLPIIAGSLLPGSIEFLVYVIFAGIGLLYYLIKAHVFYLSLGIQTLLVPAGLALVVLQAIGLGLLTSAFRGRDLRYSLQFGLSFLYFVTPVVYPLSQIPPKWRPLAESNPVTGAIEMVKDGLFNSHELTLSASAVAITGTVVLWAAGLWLLHRSLARRRALATS